MNDHPSTLPKWLKEIENETKELGFEMASEPQTGSLLRTLASSKLGGKFLELGTGTGLSACWILDGMDDQSTLITVDADESVLSIARKYLSSDPRVKICLTDGAKLIDQLQGQTFDFILADTWPGKFYQLDETLTLLASGGFYIIDDLLPQPSWPEDHAPKVPKLIDTLQNRSDLFLTQFHWATGLIVATKRTMYV